MLEGAQQNYAALHSFLPLDGSSQYQVVRASPDHNIRAYERTYVLKWDPEPSLDT